MSVQVRVLGLLAVVRDGSVVPVSAGTASTDHFRAAPEAHRRVGARQWGVLSRYRLALAHRDLGTAAARTTADRLLTDAAVDAERYDMTGLSRPC